MVNGIAQKPIEGVSMAYTFDKANADATSTRTTQYFEMFGNRAIYQDGWIATTTPPARPGNGIGQVARSCSTGYNWELYNLADDYSENNDLAAKHARQAEGTAGFFLMEAAKYNVFPLDNSVDPRASTPRPSATGGRNVLHLLGRGRRYSHRRCAEHPEQILHDHGRGGDPAWRRRRG